MSKRRGANKENLEETRRIFLEIALQEFCKEGYANASTSRIVEKSGMARGSLYYHFGDKHGLFRAVYEEMMDRAMKTVSAAMENNKDPWDAFIAGSDSYLDLCMNEDFRKITLIESQSAITFQERLEVHERTLLGKLKTILPPLMDKGYFPGHTIETIAVFIFGILGEIGRTFDLSKNIRTDRKIFGKAFADSLSQMVSA